MSQVQRRIRVLENRLQQASVRYNEAAARSRALRARIDSLRRERLLFDELAGKLQRGLARQKGEMVEVIARIAESHEAREKVRGQGRRGPSSGGMPQVQLQGSDL